MKVNKEEVLGMLVAIETYLGRDHQKDWKLWENQINLIHAAATSIPGVIGEKHVPLVANHIPSLNIKIDQAKIKMTADELRTALRNGHPSIETVGDASYVGITTWMMIPGEERTVARRLKEILSQAVKT
jgi:L-seryl-tRNA(Ser) seleniumtransferase